MMTLVTALALGLNATNLTVPPDVSSICIGCVWPQEAL